MCIPFVTYPIGDSFAAISGHTSPNSSLDTAPCNLLTPFFFPAIFNANIPMLNPGSRSSHGFIPSFKNSSLDIAITPDPVFALNQNLKQYIPSEEQIRSKYSLPAHYVLIGLRSQVYTCDELSQLNELFKKEGKECVAFNIDGVYNYTHPFNYTIPLPLSPLDWFALIKYASAYIGSNMHPIVSSLTNAVPCVSLDNWGIVDFWGRRKEGKSSKVYDVLSQYGLSDYWIPIKQGRCEATIDKLVALIDSFPVVEVRRTSEKRLYKYNNMLDEILQSIQEVNHIC